MCCVFFQLEIKARYTSAFNMAWTISHKPTGQLETSVGSGSNILLCNIILAQAPDNTNMTCSAHGSISKFTFEFQMLSMISKII